MLLSGVREGHSSLLIISPALPTNKTLKDGLPRRRIGPSCGYCIHMPLPARWRWARVLPPCRSRAECMSSDECFRSGAGWRVASATSLAVEMEYGGISGGYGMGWDRSWNMDGWCFGICVKYTNLDVLEARLVDYMCVPCRQIHAPHNFPSPLITSRTNFKPSMAKRCIFAVRSLLPVSTSLVAVSPPSFATASATYPGVRFLVVPPVGPAVPLSLTVYVLPSVLRVCSASPDTISGVGPL
jgi:hypothetical protein